MEAKNLASFFNICRNSHLKNESENDDYKFNEANLRGEELLLVSGEIVDHALVVSVEGELDLHTAPEFKHYIDKKLSADISITDLVMQMDKIKFIDSSGLGVIIGRYKQIEKRGGKLVFVSCSPQVHRILKLSGMPKIAYFADTVKEALAL